MLYKVCTYYNIWKACSSSMYSIVYIYSTLFLVWQTLYAYATVYEGRKQYSFCRLPQKKLQKLSDFHFYKSKVLMWQFSLLCKKCPQKNRGKEIKNQVRSLDSQNEIIAFIAHHRKKLHNQSDAKDLTWFFISFPLFF